MERFQRGECRGGAFRPQGRGGSSFRPPPGSSEDGEGREQHCCSFRKTAILIKRQTKERSAFCLRAKLLKSHQGGGSPSGEEGRLPRPPARIGARASCRTWRLKPPRRGSAAPLPKRGQGSARTVPGPRLPSPGAGQGRAREEGQKGNQPLGGPCRGPGSELTTAFPFLWAVSLVGVLAPFTNGTNMEAQKGTAACPRPHSEERALMRFGAQVRLTPKSRTPGCWSRHRSGGWAPCPFSLPQPGLSEAL